MIAAIRNLLAKVALSPSSEVISQLPSDDSVRQCKQLSCFIAGLGEILPIYFEKSLARSDRLQDKKRVRGHPALNLK